MVTRPVANTPAATNVIPSRALGVLGATLAAVAVWAVAVPVLGVHLAIRFGNADAQDIGVGLVVIASLIGSSAGLGLLIALEKMSTRAITIWTAISISALVISLSFPLVAGTTVSAKASLALMHVAVATILIAALRRG
ncbi:MAG: hypothetical protein E6I50_00870 [Chloroflexi bacterium]|nr:MAG: hypothetical protein E6I50_00870 [Chloroflexota bacterium]